MIYSLGNSSAGIYNLESNLNSRDKASTFYGLI